MLGLLDYAEGVPSTMHTVNKCEQILFAPIRLLTCPPQENAQPAHAARARAVQRAAADTIGFFSNITKMTEVDDFHQKNALKGRTCVLAGGATFLCVQTAGVRTEETALAPSQRHSRGALKKAPRQLLNSSYRHTLVEYRRQRLAASWVAQSKSVFTPWKRRGKTRQCVGANIQPLQVQ